MQKRVMIIGYMLKLEKSVTDSRFSGGEGLLQSSWLSATPGRSRVVVFTRRKFNKTVTFTILGLTFIQILNQVCLMPIESTVLVP